MAGVFRTPGITLFAFAIARVRSPLSLMPPKVKLFPIDTCRNLSIVFDSKEGSL